MKFTKAPILAATLIVGLLAAWLAFGTDEGSGTATRPWNAEDETGSTADGLEIAPSPDRMAESEEPGSEVSTADRTEGQPVDDVAPDESFVPSLFGRPFDSIDLESLSDTDVTQAIEQLMRSGDFAVRNLIEDGSLAGFPVVEPRDAAELRNGGDTDLFFSVHFVDGTMKTAGPGPESMVRVPPGVFPEIDAIRQCQKALYNSTPFRDHMQAFARESFSGMPQRPGAPNRTFAAITFNELGNKATITNAAGEVIGMQGTGMVGEP